MTDRPVNGSGDETYHGPIAFGIEVVDDPHGRRGVLMQMPNGYIILPPQGARQLAASLLNAADQADGTDDPVTETRT